MRRKFLTKILLSLLLVALAFPAKAQTTYTDRFYGSVVATGMKQPVDAATTTAVTLSGQQTIDTVVLTQGMRVLVKNQSNQTTNGIYNVSLGTWTRAQDFGGPSGVVQGQLVYVNGGTQAGLFILTTVNPVTIDQTGGSGSSPSNIVFSAFTPQTANGILNTICTTQGAVLYDNGSGWVCLAPGTNGQVLASQGAAANPHWITVAGSGTVTSVTYTGDGTLFSATPTAAVTTSGTLQPTILNATAKSLLGNAGSSGAAPVYVTSPVLSGSVTATALIPSGASVPTNGMYLSGANTIDWATNTTKAMEIGSDQGVTVGAPTGGDKGSGTLNAAGLYVNGTAVNIGAAAGLVGPLVTINPSAAANVTFSSTYLTSTYNRYLIKMDNLYTPNSGGDSLCVQVSHDGSSYYNADYFAITTGLDDAATSLNTNTKVESVFRLTFGQNLDNASTNPSTGTFEIGNVSSVVEQTVKWDLRGYTWAGHFFEGRGDGLVGHAAATIVAIKIFGCGGGTITGHFALYGYVN